MSWFDSEAVGDEGGRAATLQNIGNQQQGLYDTVYRPAEAQYIKSLQQDNRAPMEQRARSDYFQSMDNSNAIGLAAGRGIRPNNQGATLANVTTNARLGADRDRVAGLADAGNLSLGILGDSQKDFAQSAQANNQMIIAKANLANQTNEAVRNSAMTGLGIGYGAFERLNERKWVDAEVNRRRAAGLLGGLPNSPIPARKSRIENLWEKLT